MMPTIADRIKQRMSALSIFRQKDLAESSGVSTVQISNVLNGTRGLGADTLLSLAAVLKCDPYWLLYGKGPEPASTVIPPAVLVPILSWENLPTWLENGKSESSEMIPCPIAFTDKIFAYRVNGEAMTPLFASGDLIFIDSSQRRPVPGTFTLLFVAGNIAVAPILRQVQQIDDHPFYVALNKDLPSDLKFTACSVNDIIAGKIIGNFKRV